MSKLEDRVDNLIKDIGICKTLSDLKKDCPNFQPKEDAI
jgi:hypothetical protein